MVKLGMRLSRKDNMEYLERLKNEVRGIAEIKNLIPTLNLTDEQKRLLHILTEEGLLTRDQQVKKIESDMDFVKMGK